MASERQSRNCSHCSRKRCQFLDQFPKTRTTSRRDHPFRRKIYPSMHIPPCSWWSRSGLASGSSAYASAYASAYVTASASARPSVAASASASASASARPSVAASASAMATATARAWVRTSLPRPTGPTRTTSTGGGRARRLPRRPIRAGAGRAPWRSQQSPP